MAHARSAIATCRLAALWRVALLIQVALDLVARLPRYLTGIRLPFLTRRPLTAPFFTHVLANYCLERIVMLSATGLAKLMSAEAARMT
jgi:hypothetical protein